VVLSTRARIVAGLFASALALSFVLALTRAVPIPARALLYDYRAFACAGRIAGTAADPYRAEPLRACEHRSGLLAGRRDLARLAVPAPLPGYALAPFALLGRLPDAAGAALWVLLSLLGAALAIRSLTVLAGARVRIVWAALALPLAVALVLGQLVPLALGALCFAALAVERGRFALAAAAVWIAMIEPHVALPALLALAIFVPRARLGLGIGAIVALVLSLALLGAGKNLEYLTTVLPAHAASELANEEQYSLAYLLHRLGAPDLLALRLADLWYLAALVCGLTVAQRLVARGAPRSLYVLIPVAFAVIGGPFVHIHQMVFVLPALIVVAARVAPRARALSLAIVLLAVPWGAFGLLVVATPLVAVVIGLLTYELFPTRPLVATLAGLLAAAFVALLDQMLVPRPDAGAALLGYGDGQNVTVFALAKLPTLVGAAFGLALVLRAAIVERRPLPAGVS